MSSLIQINQPRAQPRKRSVIENVAIGFSIARNALGAGLAIPAFLQRKDALEAGTERAKFAQDQGFAKDFREVPGVPVEGQQPQLDVPVGLEGGLAQRVTKPSGAVEFGQKPGQFFEPREIEAARVKASEAQIGQNFKIEMANINNDLARGLIDKNEAVARRQARLTGKLKEDLQERGIKLKAKFARISGKDISGAERKAAGFATRLVSAERTFVNLRNEGFNRASAITGVGNIFDAIGNVLLAGGSRVYTDTERLQQEQAERNFVNAVLRPESGAVINPEEFINASLQYFPRVGDSSEVLEQKRENRLLKIQSTIAESGPRAFAEATEDPSLIGFWDLYKQHGEKITMMDKDGEQFSIPIDKFDDARKEGLVVVQY